MKAAMKMRMTDKLLVGLMVVLGLSFLLSTNAYARHYRDDSSIRRAVDAMTSDMNKANAISTAVAIAVPYVGKHIAQPIAQAVTQDIASEVTRRIVEHAIQGAVQGGVYDLATGGDGTAALYGGASGAAFGAIVNEPPQNLNPKTNYLQEVGKTMVVSEIGKGVASVAVNEWGMSPESAQFWGMATSGAVAMGMAVGDAKNQVTEARETANLINDAYGYDFKTADFVNSSTQALSEMRPIDCLTLPAIQAAIHVGVESAFKDKDWAPYVASFAGETLGTIGFTAVAAKLKNNDEGKFTKQLNDMFDSETETGKAFRREAFLDAVETTVQSVAVHNLGGSLQTRRGHAQILGNMGRTLTRNFTPEKGEDGKPVNVHRPLTGNDFVDKVAEPLIYAGASLGLEELQESKMMQKMHPVAASHFTAMNSESLRVALAGDRREDVIKTMEAIHTRTRMQNTDEKMTDFGFDPERYDGEPAGGAVYQATRSNSQVWNFSGLSNLTYGAAQTAKYGGDWRLGVMKSLGQGPFTPFTGRAGQVYDNQATQNLIGTVYDQVKQPSTPKTESYTPPNPLDDVIVWPIKN